MARGSICVVALVVAGVWFMSGPSFVNSPATQREASVAVKSGGTGPGAVAPNPNRKKLPVYGERDPLPKGYAIRTGLSDLLKPLNSEFGVTAKEDSVGTYAVMISAIVLLFLFYLLLLLITH